MPLARSSWKGRGRWGPLLGVAGLVLATVCACGSAAPRAGPSARGSTAPLSDFPPFSSNRSDRSNSSAPLCVEPQARWDEAVLYFVLVDRFADGDRSNDLGVRRGTKGGFHGGDLEGLRQQLDEIADLGATALWITPVVQNIPGFVTGAGFPDWAYHGYWADDFYHLDRRFGSEEDLRRLVRDAHARGLKVLLDVVYNHVGYGSRYLRDPATRAWLRSEDAGTCGTDDLTLCVAGLPDLRTELPQVADYLMDAHLGLAARVGVDGFRLDTVKHVSHEFWRRHRERTRSELGEGFFLLGEVWGGSAQVLDPYFAADELDAGFDFSFQGSTLAFLQGRGRPIAFEHYLENRQAVRTGYLLAHFLSSHDVPTALYLLDGDLDLFRLAAVLQLTVRGIPVINYGEEVGRLGGEWPENRSDMPWGERPVEPGEGLPRNESLRADYQRLIALRRAHPALWRGDHLGLRNEGDLLSFIRRDPEGDDLVVVAVNRGTEPVATELDLGQPLGSGEAWPDPWRSATDVLDAWGDERLSVTDGKLTLTLAPRSARILVLALTDEASSDSDSDSEPQANDGGAEPWPASA